MNNLVPTVYQEQRILTTAQLAESYRTDRQNISKNFTRNQERYVEGKHYFVLEGNAKNEFLNRVQIDDGSKNAAQLYLWTEKGAWLHAKSLNTDKAWEAYESLVDEYYRITNNENISNKERIAAPSWEKVATGEIQFALDWAKAAGVRKERTLAIALAEIEVQTGRNLTAYRRTLPGVSQESAEILNASQIGEKLNLNAREVNLKLEEIGLQIGVREVGKKPGTERLVRRNPWKLTDEGKKYGVIQDAAKRTNNSKWEGFQILWSPDVIKMLSGSLKQITLVQ